MLKSLLKSVLGIAAGCSVFLAAAPMVYADNPVPVMTGIAPQVVTMEEYEAGFTLTVQGSDFVPESVIYLSNLALPSDTQGGGSVNTTHFVSSTELTAFIQSSPSPAAGSYFNISVVNPAPGGGTAYEIAQPAPHPAQLSVVNFCAFLSSLTPDGAPAGSSDVSITVTSDNGDFQPDHAVFFDDYPLTTTYNSSTEVVAVIPASLLVQGTYDISVGKNSEGQSGLICSGLVAGSTVLPFTVGPANLPLIDNLVTNPDPATENAQFDLTVSGQNFDNAVIHIDDVAQTTSFISSSQLNATVSGVAAGTYQVTVVNMPPVASAGTSNAMELVIQGTPPPPPPPSGPVIFSFVPGSATEGDGNVLLTVSGANFTSGSVVYFDNNPLVTSFVNSGQVTATIPASYLVADTYPIYVNVPGVGTSEAAPNGFVVKPAPDSSNPVPVITSIDPAQSAPGDPPFFFHVYGSNFVPGAVISSNGIASATTFISSTHLQYSSQSDPSGSGWVPGTYWITVTNPSPGGGTSNEVPFTVTGSSGGGGGGTGDICSASQELGNGYVVLSTNYEQYLGLTMQQWQNNDPRYGGRLEYWTQVGGTWYWLWDRVNYPHKMVRGDFVNGLWQTSITDSLAYSQGAWTASSTNPCVQPALQGNLRIVKNASGGTGSPSFQFSLMPTPALISVSVSFASGSSAAGEEIIALDEGIYDLAEQVPNDWVLTSVVCDNGNVFGYGASGITIAAGQTVTCTFTNAYNYVPPPDGGGSVCGDGVCSASESASTCSADCTAPSGQGIITFVAQAEGGDGAFSFVTGNNSTGFTVNVPTSGGYGSKSAATPVGLYSLSISGAGFLVRSVSCMLDGQTYTIPGVRNVVQDFPVQEGKNTICTGVFVKPGCGNAVCEEGEDESTCPADCGGSGGSGGSTQLEIVKNAVGGDDTFEYFLGIPYPMRSVTTVSGNGTILMDIDPGTYTIKEIATVDWTLTRIECRKGSTATGTPIIDGMRNVVIPQGGKVTCSFTNIRKTGNLIINKRTIGGDGTFSYFLGSDYPVTPITTVKQRGSATVADLNTGSYTIQEIASVGWQLDKISCTDGSGKVKEVFSGNSISGILISSNKDTVCTFTNSRTSNGGGGGGPICGDNVCSASENDQVCPEDCINKVPVIANIIPSSIVVGSAPPNIVVNGENFLSSSTLTFYPPVPLAPITMGFSFASATQLNVRTEEANTLPEGTYQVMVANPSPGGGNSNAVEFSVIASSPSCDGDQVCEKDQGENTSTCPSDCPAPVNCGNGVCGPGENYSNCPSDCPSRAPGPGTPGGGLRRDCNIYYEDCPPGTGQSIWF